MKKIIPFLFLFPLVSLAQSTITTIAGIGIGGYSGDGFPATAAKINGPSGVIADASGNIYFCDYYNNTIRKINPSGIITTIGGNGVAGYSGDGGPATAAQLNAPAGLGIDASGNLFIAEYINNTIRKINSSGIISTIGGTTAPGYSGDGGPATAARFNGPESIFLDATGNLYVGDGHNHSVRMINTAGIITTVAGTGISTFNGDGIAATIANLYDPFGIFVDATGNIFIADQDHNRVRMVNTSGIISTIAGNGINGYSGDGGPATAATLGRPTGVWLDATGGNIFIADRYNNVVRKLDAAGSISTVAGTGVASYSGDGGPATSATINNIPNIYVNHSGQIYICDFYNNRIRMITANCPGDIVSHPVHDTVFSGYDAVFTVTAGSIIPSYQWQEDPGSGFVSLANVWPYSGVNTSTLTIHNTSMFLNATHYRCILSYEASCPPDTSRSAILIVRSTTGLTLPSRGSSINVFPNPVHDDLTIELPNQTFEGTVQIINKIGEKVTEKKINTNSVSMQISNLPPGIYFLKINMKNQVIYKKIIKE